ncbi:uncharacterized protein B0H18DRAFT_982898, partial [Fomitopsis serialis]|uniref:uncharacterized protein n=1 Tax=Fomitopsis serialis TaxID=139415 RepID=UPI0020086919
MYTLIFLLASLAVLPLFFLWPPLFMRRTWKLVPRLVQPYVTPVVHGHDSGRGCCVPDIIFLPLFSAALSCLPDLHVCIHASCFVLSYDAFLTSSTQWVYAL